MNESKRKNSLFIPCDNTINWKNLSPSGKNSNNSIVPKKMRLRSNSIFAYQEYEDKFTIFWENKNNSNNKDSNSDTFNNNIGKDEESSSNSSESSDNEDETSPKQKQSKRLSDGNWVYSNMSFFNPNSPSPRKNHKIYTQNMTGNDNNNYIFTPIPLNQTDNFRRNSVVFYPPYSISTFTQKNINNQSTLSSFGNQQHKSISAWQQFQNQIGITNFPVWFNTNTSHKMNSTTLVVPQGLTISNGNINILNQKAPNTLDDAYVLNNLNQLWKEKYSCHQVQEKLEENKNDTKFISLFFKHIEHNIPDIMCDQFGNYVLQKYFEIIINFRYIQLISAFFTALYNNTFNLAINNFGTRVFQKALEKLDDGVYTQLSLPAISNIFKTWINNHLFDWCIDKNGNHVFQKIVRIVPKTENGYIYESLNIYAVDISKLEQGATIIQTAIKFASPEQKSLLLMIILNQIEMLINDCYGNFIIQTILEQKEPEFNQIIYEYVKKNIIVLSKKKFSSNVIDKCIVQEDIYSYDLISCLIENNVFKEILNDQFGNYVVQKALTATSGDLFMSIIQQIEPVMLSLKQSNLGRKIYERIIKNYGMYLQNITNKVK